MQVVVEGENEKEKKEEQKGGETRSEKMWDESAPSWLLTELASRVERSNFLADKQFVKMFKLSVADESRSGFTNLQFDNISCFRY